MLTIAFLLTYQGLLAFGSVCTSDDRFVIATVHKLQEFYRLHNRFPDQNSRSVPTDSNSSEKELLRLLEQEYRADTFSNAGPAEFFVYFKSNCKLQVRPESHDVYPTR